MIVAQIGGVFGPVILYIGGFMVVILGYLGASVRRRSGSNK